jgi:hypothetical protein
MNMPARRFVYAGPESPLEGVSTAAWQRFIAALEVQPTDAVSASGGLGAYSISPRRVAELTPDGGSKLDVRTFITPRMRDRFLKDPDAQYRVLAKSMRAYYDALRNGELKKPQDCSMAGALVVLHIGGRGALAGFPKLFERTQALYEKAQGAF